VDVTAQELKLINPALELTVHHHWGDDVVKPVLERCDVVVNGMDELGACLRLWRSARQQGIPVVDAWSSPLPNVFVVRPGEPTPEEFLEYPTREHAPSDLTPAQIDECKSREALHCALHSRSLRYLDVQVIREILGGERARISFAPMVWGAGLLMAWEAIKLVLDRGDVATRFGRFFDPWRGELKNARGFTRPELMLIRAGLRWTK
jgi:hypothetical protein